MLSCESNAPRQRLARGAPRTKASGATRFSNDRDCIMTISVSELSASLTPVAMLDHMTVAIQCRDLRKTYDEKVETVRGLNLEIQLAECCGLLAPNGAAKTTTIDTLEVLEHATP